MGIMNSSKKLLNLMGILAIGSFSFQEALAIDDLDDTLKQAIFLVKLLKTDFAQVLRANDDFVANSTEEEDKNSTCSLPLEDFNSTVAINETAVTVSVVSSKDGVSTTALTPASLSPVPPQSPPPPPNGLPGAPVMPYATWPAMPMGYPPSIPVKRSFPDENYRFPYRLSRRRMMPDYYYYAFKAVIKITEQSMMRSCLGPGLVKRGFSVSYSPVRGFGNFRRSNNDPIIHLDNISATPQQTPSSLPSVTSEATTLHVEGTTAASLPTTKAQRSTSILPATNHANKTLLVAANSTNQSILSTAKSTKQSILSKTKEPNLHTITSTTLKTKPRKKVRQKKRVPKPKASTTVISKSNMKHVRVRSRILRQNTAATTTNETITNETIGTHDVEIAQVALELENELVLSEETGVHNVANRISKSTKATRKRKKTTTMKIFLKGSSRIPIPFPENNAFCHFHPESSICGANK